MNKIAELRETMARINNAIDAASSRTPGVWRWKIDANIFRAPYADLVSDTQLVLAPRHDGNFQSQLHSTEADRSFIAACSENMEPALKSNVDALFSLGMIINECVDFADGSPDASPRDKLANEILEVANKAMESIINHWRKQK